MALVLVCDRCQKILSDSDHVEIIYYSNLNGRALMPSRLTETLCKECFEEEYGKGHLEDIENRYNMRKQRKELL